MFTHASQSQQLRDQLQKSINQLPQSNLQELIDLLAQVTQPQPQSAQSNRNNEAILENANAKFGVNLEYNIGKLNLRTFGKKIFSTNVVNKVFSFLSESNDHEKVDSSMPVAEAKINEEIKMEQMANKINEETKFEEMTNKIKDTIQELVNDVKLKDEQVHRYIKQTIDLESDKMDLLKEIEKLKLENKELKPNKEILGEEKQELFEEESKENNNEVIKFKDQH